MRDEERSKHFREVYGKQPFSIGTYRYEICSKIIEWFKSTLPVGSKFVFDKPCNGGGSYDIYAVANVEGIIMAETILNSTKMRGSDKHDLSTKGTESPAGMLNAANAYLRGYGTLEQHPEYKKGNITLSLA